MSSEQNTVLAPVTDHGAKIAMWIGSWRDHMPVVGHGSMTENPILCPGDPHNPSTPGAVLKWASRFHRAQLEPGASTSPVTHESEQEVLYVVRGEGTFRSEDRSEAIGPGIAILIPPSVPHALENTSTSSPLEVLWLAEQLDERASPAKELIIRNTRELPIVGPSHWVYIGRDIFSRDDGLTKLHTVATVTVPAMSMAEPHSHGVEQEEVWYQMHGNSYLLLGRTLRLQEAGTAFKVPPDGCTPHSAINISNSPLEFFLFARF